MEAAAERACRHIGYRNAGTFEFLVGPDGSFSFIELNARLQVEHPVTELVTGIDLVREQVRIAAGERARPRRPRRPALGHAIEMRINAEDPSRGFAPAPGRLDALPAAARPRRARRHVRRGGLGDPAVLRLADREGDRPRRQPRTSRSSARCARCDEFEIEGVPTTRDVALEILDSDEFRSGDYSTSFLEEAGARLPALAGMSSVLVQESDGTVRVSEAALSEIVGGRRRRSRARGCARAPAARRRARGRPRARRARARGRVRPRAARGRARRAGAGRRRARADVRRRGRRRRRHGRGARPCP